MLDLCTNPHVESQIVDLSKQVLACALPCRAVRAQHIVTDSEKYDAGAVDMQCSSFSAGVHLHACSGDRTQSMPHRLLPYNSALEKTHMQKCKSAARVVRSKRQLAAKATQESLVQQVLSPILPSRPRLVRTYKAAYRLRTCNTHSSAAGSGTANRTPNTPE